jgi:DNA processing protein
MQTTLPPAAYAAVLAGLPGVGPVGLAELLRREGPETAWELVVRGEITRMGNPVIGNPVSGDPGAGRPAGRGPAGTSWTAAARGVDVAAHWTWLQDAGIGVTFFGDPLYPGALSEDPHPPGVLFWRGELATLAHPRVAIVGTRRCTSYGRETAFVLGRDLAQAGVAVVSGLALGIDGAAHAGVLAAAGSGAAGSASPASPAGPVAVAASGVDRPYPRQHRQLWSKVATTGVVLSETPCGQPAQAWRFPVRNRIIAGLSQLVVVVESHQRGGALHTVDAALDRGIEVRAVPGPVTSSSSAGTNQLLWDGPGPVRHAGDVLDVLGEIRPWPPPTPPERRSAAATLEEASRRVLDAVDATPTSMTVISERTGLALGQLSAILFRLEAGGLVQGSGSWWERRAPP